ncbi:hypothetical protein MNAN1_004006a, partial [Malassezia nana]
MLAAVDECLVALNLIRRLKLEYLHASNTGESHHFPSLKPKEALLTFTQRLCDHCWRAVGGPRCHDSLVGKSMVVSAQSIPLLSDESLSQHRIIHEPFRDLVASLPANYALMLLPIVTLRLLCSIPDPSSHYTLLETDFPAHLMTYLVSKEAFCEGPDQMIQKRAYFSDMDSRSKTWVQAKLQVYLKTSPMSPFAWLHPDILDLYSDYLFESLSATEDVIPGTRSIVTGLLSAIQSSGASQIAGIPLPLFYDRLAREISERIRSMWLKSKAFTSKTSEQKLNHYILAMFKCVSKEALGQHPQLSVVAIELGILAMISTSMQNDTVTPFQMLHHTECHVCKLRRHECATHRQVVSMITCLYQNQEDVNLQSVTDSPQSSPLCAMSADGLDLGYTFLLVAKLMQWHGLALPEAQALSVCSEWMISKEMPCSSEFFKRLSALQTNAEDRAIKNMCATNSKAQSSYVYDDVMDAWVCVKKSSRKHQLYGSDKENMPMTRGSPTTKRNDQKGRPGSNLARKAIEIPICEEDEIDFLSNKSNLGSSRVCRKVQRLDIGKEAQRYNRARYRQRQRQSWIPYL